MVGDRPDDRPLGAAPLDDPASTADSPGRALPGLTLGAAWEDVTLGLRSLHLFDGDPHATRPRQERPGKASAARPASFAGVDGRLGAAGEPELVQQGRDVVLDRLLREEERGPDLLVRQPVGDEVEDATFLRAEGGEAWIVRLVPAPQ